MAMAMTVFTQQYGSYDASSVSVLQKTNSGDPLNSSKSPCSGRQVAQLLSPSRPLFSPRRTRHSYTFGCSSECELRQKLEVHTIPDTQVPRKQPLNPESSLRSNRSRILSSLLSLVPVFFRHLWALRFEGFRVVSVSLELMFPGFLAQGSTPQRQTPRPKLQKPEENLRQRASRTENLE